MNKLELYIDGVQVDVPTTFSLRMNRTVSDPSRINGGSAEYSFQFTLPASSTNNKVFGFANALPVQGKFMRRYPAEVYTGGTKVFTGDLTLTSYDAVENEYTCNLVSIKVNTVEDIFGDMTLHDLEWYIPYLGAPTINSLNANASSEVCFPLVAYGLFEKDPVYSDEVADDYTDRLLLDDSVRWYHETFYPSLNVLSLIRRLFEQKGYTLQGDVLDDEVLKNIYCSVSLGSDQPLNYNIANSKIGSADVSLTWTNWKSEGVLYDGVIRDLNYKYCHVTPDGGQAILDNYHGTPPMQWDEIEVYNLFGEGSRVTPNLDTYLFDEGEQCLVVPADGCYRFDLEVTASLDTTWNNGKVNVARKVMTVSQYPVIETVNVNLDQDIQYICPIEIQLTRNTLGDEGDIELIKGVHNRDWIGSSTSASNYDTCYPHEMLFDQKNPTDVDPIYNVTGENINDRVFGYMPSQGSVFAYDPNVSRDFICGFSTYLGGTAAVTKNNKSWYRGLKDYTQSLYKSAGYDYVKANTYYVTSRVPTSILRSPPLGRISERLRQQVRHEGECEAQDEQFHPEGLFIRDIKGNGLSVALSVRQRPAFGQLPLEGAHRCGFREQLHQGVQPRLPSERKGGGTEPLEGRRVVGGQGGGGHRWTVQCQNGVMVKGGLPEGVRGEVLRRERFVGLLEHGA